MNSYYFNADGVMQTGWQTIDNETYYFKNDGVMAAATTLFIDDAEYTFDETGNLKLPQADGWAEENGAYVEYDGKKVYYDNFSDEGEEITEFCFLHAKAYTYIDQRGLHVTVAGVNEKNTVSG